MTRILLSLLAFYQRWISPALHALSGGTGCRFVPTCSEYAVVAIETHGPVRGSGLAIRRLLRCHPFSRGGLDQVPVLGANAKGRLAPASQPGGRLPHEPLT